MTPTGAPQASPPPQAPAAGTRSLANELRGRELADRLRWFVVTRWWAVALCLGGTLVAHLRWLPARLDARYFLAVAVILALSNLGAGLRARRGFSGVVAMRWFLFVQMLTDFAALSLLTYACGTVETPVATLFMLHIILATQLFPRKYSRIATGVAWLFASAPLLLEFAGVLPVLSIFDGQLKAYTSGSLRVTLGFVAGFGGSYFVCWYLVSRIASSLKRREEQLQDAFELLQRMDREKTQATLRATHELKAPFAAIKSYVYTLRDGYCGPLPERAVQVVDRIGERCDRLTDKITDIIHLSNLRTHLPRPEELSVVELRALLAKETREAALHGEPRRITVSFAAEGPSVHVLGSTPLLSTLFSNLLRNAVQYSRDGGHVILSLEEVDVHALVVVEDQGIGIPEANLEKIFEEHFRSNNAVAHHPGGTGLGLPIVREILRLHGGAVKVQSEVDRGTTFSVTLPAVPPKEKGGAHGEGADH